MSKMVAVRIDERLLEGVDRERRRTGLSRARAIREALNLWLERRQYDADVRAEHDAYARRPQKKDEYAPFLEGQAWPK